MTDEKEVVETEEVADVAEEVTETAETEEVAPVEVESDALWQVLGVVTEEKGLAELTRTTRAMEVFRGCVVHVSTDLVDKDGGTTFSESIVFVPGVRIANGKLIQSRQ